MTTGAASGATPGDLAPGSVVDEYEVVYKLGQGGMGAVYRARHMLLGKDVALKVIAPHRAADPRFKTRFFREAKVALEFVHRHAIPLRDFGVADSGLCYMTMDFSPGVPLGALVRREGALPVARACRLLCQMLEALSDAHRKRIVHRDLKPDNVLVETDEHGSDFVKVLDFGLAKMSAEDDAALANPGSGAVVVGTPSYMAPEQAGGESVDARADLYACGVILFYLVTGKLPFQAASTRELIMQHIAKAPPALADARPEVAFPWGFEAALRRALEKKADARYTSAEDMGDALEPFATPKRRRGSTGTMKAFKDVIVPGVTAQEDTRSPAPAPLADVARGAATSGRKAPPAPSSGEVLSVPPTPVPAPVPSPIPGPPETPSPSPISSVVSAVHEPTPATPRAPLTSTPISGAPTSASSPSHVPVAPVTIGETIDRYRVLERIAEGAYGVVYRAEHTEMHRACALKVIRPEIASDPSFVDRFRREAKITARFRHPSAVEVHDFGSAGGRLFMAMELLPGSSLAYRLRDEGPLALADAVEVTLQVLDCLEAAHRQGIVHRDLKPANVMLGEVDGWRNQVKVLDFGIAKVRDPHADPAAAASELGVIGTPQYASPEQCRGDAHIDGRSDLYAVGVMLFEMLTGKLPYDATTPSEMVRAHVGAEPRRLDEVRPEIDVPEEVEGVIRRALAKGPEMRFPSARAMEDALREAACVSTIFEAGERGVRPARRRAARSRLGRRAATIAAVLGLATLLIVLQSQGLLPHRSRTASGDGAGGADERAGWERSVRADAPAAWRKARAEIEAAGGLRARGRVDEALESARRFAALEDPGPAPRAPPPHNDDALGPVRAEAAVLVRALERIAPLHHDMILVGAGEAVLGSGRYLDNEKPEHRVALGAFLLDRTEVSGADYALFLEDEGGRRAPPRFDGRRPAPGTERLPVTGVTLDEAEAFARWAGKRLPLEAEWERAARGPSGRIFPWGAEWDISQTPERALIKATRASARRAPIEVDASDVDNRHPDGFLHLAGNVAEWTGSRYRLYPKHPHPRAELGIGSYTVVKGGDFETTLAPSDCRGSYRLPLPPETRSPHVGFRCAKDAE